MAAMDDVDDYADAERLERKEPDVGGPFTGHELRIKQRPEVKSYIEQRVLNV